MPGPAFLTGERVSLRTVEEEDAEFVHESVNMPEIRKPMHASNPYTLNEIRALFDSDSDSSAVRLLVTDGTEPVGMVGFSDVDEIAGTAALSCWIRPSGWGEGYGTEAVELLVEYGFDQRRLHKFVAEVVEFNEASRRLVEKVGFVEEGRRREHDFVDGEYHDCLSYGLLAAEWRDRRRDA